jgi:peroxiredoxin
MEIPDFIKMQDKYKSDLVVIGVSLDRQKETVPPFIKRNGINYPILYGDQNVVVAYGNISNIPTTFVIDQSGCIIKKFVGARPGSEFENEIKPLLKTTVTMK